MDRVETLKSQEFIPVEQLLSLLGFEENKLGNYERTWGPLNVSAALWLGGWQVSSYWVGGRKAGYLEFRIPLKISPAGFLAVLYENTHDAFASMQLPPELGIGKEESKYRATLRELMPSPPTIWADRHFFRFCLSRIEKNSDWSVADFQVNFAVVSGQLRFVAADLTVYCPARGAWLGTSEVSGRELFRKVPKRFADSVVRLEQHGKALVIGGRHIGASWRED
jgi:hypothetical protein